jgi:hypothetical protein
MRIKSFSGPGHTITKIFPQTEKKTNLIWTSGITLAGCVLEVTDFKEIVQWCADNFISEQRIIQLQGHQPISLAPSTFSKMLRLPAPTMWFKNEEDDEFMKQHKGGNRFLRNYLEDPTSNPKTSRIEVTSLKNLYREFAWLFTHIVGMESTMFISRNVIYSLHYALHEKSIIDWGYLISNEISFQLNNLKKTRKFYMTSYLIFSIAYGHVFEDFPREKHVDFKLEPVYVWYSVLYRHKAQYNFYSVHNNFIS